MESTPLLSLSPAPAKTFLERQRALKERGVGKAAHLVKDAVFGFQDAPYEGFYDPYQNEHTTLRNDISVLCGRLVVQLKGAVRLCCWILFLVSFFEPPYWCRDASHLDIVSSYEEESPTDISSEIVKEYGDCKLLLNAYGTTIDGEENQSYYPNSQFVLLTLYQTKLVELACVGFIALYLTFAFADDGFETRFFFYPGYKRWTHATQCILVACIATSIVCDSTKYNPFFRMLMLGTFRRPFQEEFWTFLKMFPKMVLPFSLLVLIVVFYAWIGVVIFYDTPQGTASFPNLPEGIWTLWTAATTANYPDVMMPSYNEHRGAALFGTSFMVLVYFYVMNLILAIAVDSYDKRIEERKSSRKQLTERLLSEAFALLNHDGLVSRKSIMNVMTIINQDLPEIRGLSQEEQAILFGFLDKDGNNAINREEFLSFGTVLLLRLEKQSDYATFVETHFPSFYASDFWSKVCAIVKSERFDHVVEIILVLNAIVVAAQDYPMLAGVDVSQDPHYKEGYIDTVYEQMETIFTVIYVMEAGVKILVNGWRRYIESHRNTFDFVITILVCLASAYVYYPNAYNDHALIELIVMIRVLRLGRLLFAIKRFRAFGAISWEIAASAGSVFMVLLFIAYIFASLGMLLYGGDITRDPNNPKSHLLMEAADFVDNAYWGNNFNDMASSLIVLFNWLVVNNWPEQTAGMIHTSCNKWMVRLFFLSFYILGVIGVSNVITSFVINAFFQQMATIRDRLGPEERIEGEATLRGSRAVFDPSNVTGTSTGVKDTVYFARIRPKHRDVELDEREALRRLFTGKTSSNTSDVES